MPLKYKIPVNIIKLDEKSFHLLIEVKINGLPVNVLIDTGASRTVFDKSLPGVKLKAKSRKDPEEIHSAGIMAGSIDSQVAVVKSFKLGKLKLHKYKVILIDLDNINQLYLKATGKQIHGLLGSDFLLDMNAIIDYSKAYLILKPQAPQS
jgi:hypothetical protein